MHGTRSLQEHRLGRPRQASEICCWFLTYLTGFSAFHLWKTEAQALFQLHCIKNKL